MRPATAISADGPMNLLEAVTVAADPDARGRGVMVVLNDRIGAARFVTKTNATSLDTFRAPEEGYLGVVVGGKPQFETRVDKIHAALGVRCASAEGSAEGGDYLWLRDDPEYMYDAAIAHHADGIIYAGTGAGSVSVRSAAGIKKRSRRASWWCEPPVPAAASYRRMTASPGWWPTPSTRQKRVYC